MNTNNDNRHMVDILFVLTLFFVFALSMVTLVILGANVYRKTVDHMGQNFDNRTSYSYLTQKFREYDDSNASITLTDFGDSDACIISCEINNTIYNTYLYLHDGYLCELLCRADLDLDESAGTKIIKLDRFNISKVNDTTYKFTICTSTGEDTDLYLYQKSLGGIKNE